MIIIRTLIVEQPVIGSIFISGQYGKVKTESHL